MRWELRLEIKHDSDTPLYRQISLAIAERAPPSQMRRLLASSKQRTNFAGLMGSFAVSGTRAMARSYSVMPFGSFALVM